MARIVRTMGYLVAVASAGVLAACGGPDIKLAHVERLPNLVTSEPSIYEGQQMVVYRTAVDRAQLKPIVASGDNLEFPIYRCGEENRRRYETQVYLEETPVGGWLSEDHAYDRAPFKPQPIWVKIEAPAQIVDDQGFRCGRFERLLLREKTGSGFGPYWVSNEVRLPAILR